jgi:KUP system potassium uptake protein
MLRRPGGSKTRPDIASVPVAARALDCKNLRRAQGSPIRGKFAGYVGLTGEDEGCDREFVIPAPTYPHGNGQKRVLTIVAKSADAKQDAHRGGLAAVALGALGVVYGDIGTSPLYTFKTALDWAGGAATDGAITPAISVLSALEGIKAPVPEFAPYVLPLSVVVLIAVFGLQPHGSARIGKLFGPVMTVWFVTIGVLGLSGILRHPGVLTAVDPRYGLAYLFGHGMTGFLVLGGVFLCATGAEALYADMGHFGPRPIRFAWYGLVLPTLLLNYAGQTAIVVDGAVSADANPFFLLCPPFLQAPLVALATAATIIASQAIISGTFSMTRQAIQLGLCPRLHITQTSSEGYGQIYVGFVNWVLMALTLGLALAFRSSDNLAAAFGIAVSLTMLLTTMLIFLTMRDVWGWSLPLAIGVAGVFTVVDLSFVAANLMKVVEGGWVPLVVATLLFFAMSAWRQGRTLLARKLERDTLPLRNFIIQMHEKSRVSGTAVYMTSRVDVVPVPLLHNLKHNKVLHRRIVLLHVVTQNIPRVAPDKRVEVTHLGDDFHAIVAHYGFMQQPNVPRLLAQCSSHGLHFDMMDTSFFVGRVTIVPEKSSRFGSIRRELFAAMHRNAQAATEFFHIPPNRVVELGGQVEI